MITKYKAQSKWAKANPEVMEIARKKWRDKNPNYHRDYIKKWNKRNKGKVRFYEKQREYRERNAEGSFTLKEWEIKKKFFKFKCAICKISEEKLLNTTREGLTIDHIIPLIKGGTNYIVNIQPLCRKCNLKKGVS